MRSVLRSVYLLLALWLAPFGAQAMCQFASGVTGEIPGYISFGNVIVQRDAPVGSVIATATTGAYNNGQTIAGCDEPYTFRWELTKWTTLSVLPNTYKTNVAGVGIRLSSTSSGRYFPFDANYSGGNYIIFPDDGVKAELVKTGEIIGGTLDPGVLARASIVNQFYFANVTLNGTSRIVSAACKVLTPDIDVSLGDHRKNEFSGPGSVTDWKVFFIDLECAVGTRVSMTINATADSASTPDVIKLDSSGGTASGIGVQLWAGFPKDDGPVELGKLTYYGLTNGGYNLKFQARYYQTGQSVTAGTANATATFTTTYR